MSADNLAIVFAPNIFRCPALSLDSSISSRQSFMEQNTKVTEAMVGLMKSYNRIYEKYSTFSMEPETKSITQKDAGKLRKDFKKINK